MYLGMACAYAGAALAAGALWSSALLPGVLLVIDRAIVPREERHLAERFGEEYERYRLRVPRWL
jgi:protein-S-isoprenylcysteine O-methyltransferase Ste14